MIDVALFNVGTMHIHLDLKFRKLSLIVVSLITLLVLAACGGSSSSSPTEESTGIPSAEQLPVINTGSTSPTVTPGVVINPTEEQIVPASVSTVADPIVQALRSGDASDVGKMELLDEAIRTGEQDLVNCVENLTTIYPQGLVTATMPYLSNYVYSSRRKNYPLHVANESGAAYSWIGEQEDGTRYVYFGAGMFQMTDSEYWGSLGVTLKDNTLDVMAWITQSDNINALTSSDLRIVALTLRAQHQLEAWLQSHEINTSWTITTDLSQITTGQYDLFVGMVGEEIPQVSMALNSQKPVMLWSEVFNPGASIAPLGLSWNWWGQQTVGDATSVQSQCDRAFPGREIVNAFKSLRDEQLDFDYTEDVCPTPVYTTQCNADKLIRTDGKNLQDVFLSGAQELQKRIQRADFEDSNIFDSDDSARMTKFAVLIGDSFRADSSFPMDKETSTPIEFFGSYFADHTVHYARDTMPALADAGNFSDHLATISEKSSEAVTVTLSPTAYDEWSSTGVTGRAGKPVTIARRDNNPSQITVRFNMIRSGSTWEWNQDGYNRPKFVASHQVALPPHSTVTLNSPVGGPLYVHWEAQAVSAADFELHIDGGVKHPLLSTFDEQSINEFSTALVSDDFDWVDIKTPFAEVHSLTQRMINAFNIQDGDPGNGYTTSDVQEWISDLNNYLIGTNLGLAGFIGDGLPDMKPDVMSFCVSRQLNCDDATIHRKPPIQHINADRNASCGDLCSGNPFDLNSYIKPLGFGESHEMGHNLQRHRFNFYGVRSGESSNNIFPHYSAYRWLLDQNLSRHPSIRLPDPQKAYDQLQTSLSFNMMANEGHPIWTDGEIYVNADVRLMLYLQLVYIHDQWEFDPDSGADGWDLYTKLYKLERQYNDALQDNSRWLSQREALGFSTYDRTMAQSITGNDFMAIALSWISNTDHRAYLDAWGIAIESAASAQIESNGFTDTVPLIYWRSPDDRFLRADIPSRDPANAMPLDGITPW